MKPKVIVPAGKQEEVFMTLNDVAEVRFIPLTDRERLFEELRDAVALVADTAPIDEELLERAPKLRIVARFGVGYDNVDVEACTRRGIYVTYTPNVLSDAVADLTIGLMLCLSRNIIRADRYVRSRWAVEGGFNFPLGLDLEGKVLGIIGLGRIGYAVASRAKAFGMEIIYYDIVRKGEAEEKIGVRYVEFEDLLKSSDFVTIHVSLNEKTRGMIGERELKLMKPTAYLINTSRGPVIDEEALVKALKEGWIAGAALDVFVEEPLPLDNPLTKMENVILTPHIGSATKETRRRMALVDIENIRAVLEGRVPPNLIPEQRGKTFMR